MAIPIAKNNIVIILMSLSLLAALTFGVFVGNRMLTHWLLVRGLEQAFLPHEHSVVGILNTFTAGTAPRPADQPKGLRLTRTDARTDDKALLLTKVAQIQTALDQQHAPAQVLDAALVYPAETVAARPELPVFSQIPWAKNRDLKSARPVNLAWSAYKSGRTATAIPDMTWFGTFGPNALVVFNPKTAGPGVPTLVLLVSEADLLNALAGLLWWCNAAAAALCVLSFLGAGLLWWLRYSDQLRANSSIQYLAHHDTLTGLPNRAVFNAKLAEALRTAQAKASNIGVMLIDVDQFKDINDTHGHGVGDVFLQIVAERLETVFHKHMVARLSGDEFAVLLTSISDPARMTRLAADMISATAAPCVIDGKEIKLSLSIGIARATDGSWRLSRLMHCADLALYSAKHSGRSTFAWYTPVLDAEAQKRKEVENGLVKALKLDQFKLVYQPQYGLRDGVLHGYEAFVRWEHPSKGEIRPDLFLPVAEDCGLIDEIGTWVLNHACREAMLWTDQTRRISVNVSTAQFVPGETQKKVAQALNNSGLDPRRLEIEVTESLLISNTEAVIATLRQIHNMGVSIVMDDFGTGHSSLSYLSRFPFDKIKIDQAFVHNLGKDESTDAIVTSIVGLGRSLDVTIIAEGVETEEQAVLLSAAGCDLVQGYMFGKPNTVELHEANYPVFPLNETGGLWLPNLRAPAAPPPKISLSPELAQFATLAESGPQTEKASGGS